MQFVATAGTPAQRLEAIRRAFRKLIGETPSSIASEVDPNSCAINCSRISGTGLQRTLTGRTRSASTSGLRNLRQLAGVVDAQIAHCLRVGEGPHPKGQGVEEFLGPGGHFSATSPAMRSKTQNLLVVNRVLWRVDDARVPLTRLVEIKNGLGSRDPANALVELSLLHRQDRH